MGFQYRSLDDAAKWLNTKLGGSRTAADLLRMGANGEVELLACIPGYSGPGEGELRWQDNNTGNPLAACTDGLVKLSAHMAGVLNTHGRVNLNMVSVNVAGMTLNPGPEPGVVVRDDVRIEDSELGRIEARLRQERLTPLAIQPSAESNQGVEAWKKAAREIGEGLLPTCGKLNLEQIAKKVREEMVRRQQVGEKGMTGRGSKVPSADTIKRHALTGLKTSRH